MNVEYHNHRCQSFCLKAHSSCQILHTHFSLITPFDINMRFSAVMITALAGTALAVPQYRPAYGAPPPPYGYSNGGGLISDVAYGLGDATSSVVGGLFDATKGVVSGLGNVAGGVIGTAGDLLGGVLGLGSDLIGAVLGNRPWRKEYTDQLVEMRAVLAPIVQKYNAQQQ